MRKGETMSDAQRALTSASLTGKKQSAETIKARSASMSGEINPNYGKTMSDEQRTLISLSRLMADFSGEKNSFYGKKHTPASLEKMRIVHTGVVQSAESNALRSAAESGEKNHFFGKKHTDATKQKIREARLGTHPTDEARENMRKARKGKPQSAEHVAARVKSMYAYWATKGIPEELTAEQRYVRGYTKGNDKRKKTPEELAVSRAAKVVRMTGENNPFFGQQHTDETKQIISAANTGRVVSDEQRAAMSAASTGRVVSDETRQKQRDAMNNLPPEEKEIRRQRSSAVHLGKTVSEKTRKLLSEALTGRTQTPEHVQNMLRGIKYGPSSYEVCLMELIQKNDLPFKFVGDGKQPDSIIGYVCPDFRDSLGLTPPLVIETYTAWCHPETYEDTRYKKLCIPRENVLFLTDADFNQGRPTKLDEQATVNRLTTFLAAGQLRAGKASYATV
jgi:hypothetical protein